MTEKTNFKVNKNFDIAKIPNGVWMRQEEGIVLLGVTTQNRQAAFILTFFLFLIMLVCLDDSENIEYNMMYLIVGIFFMILTIPVWAIILMAIGGKVEVTLEDEKCKIFKGFWKFGSTIIFDLNTISIEKEKDSSGNYDICLKSKNKTVLSQKGTFSWLEGERLVYLMSAIVKILQDKNNFLQEDLSEHLI